MPSPWGVMGSGWWVVNLLEWSSWCWQVLWWVLVADLLRGHPGGPGCGCLLTETLMKGAKICLF